MKTIYKLYYHLTMEVAKAYCQYMGDHIENVEIYSYGMFDCSDRFIYIDDVILAIEKGVPSEVFSIWYDMRSETYRPDRLEEEIKKDKSIVNINVYMFYKTFGDKCK